MPNLQTKRLDYQNMYFLLLQIWLWMRMASKTFVMTSRYECGKAFGGDIRVYINFRFRMDSRSFF